jgi:hypothetical protein
MFDRPITHKLSIFAMVAAIGGMTNLSLAIKATAYPRSIPANRSIVILPKAPPTPAPATLAATDIFGNSGVGVSGTPGNPNANATANSGASGAGSTSSSSSAGVVITTNSSAGQSGAAAQTGTLSGITGSNGQVMVSPGSVSAGNGASASTIGSSSSTVGTQAGTQSTVAPGLTSGSGLAVGGFTGSK